MPSNPEQRAQYNKKHYEEYKEDIQANARDRYRRSKKEPIPCPCGGCYTKVGNTNAAQNKHEKTYKHMVWNGTNNFMIPNRKLINKEYDEASTLRFINKKYDREQCFRWTEKWEVMITLCEDLDQLARGAGLKPINRNVLKELKPSD